MENIISLMKVYSIIIRKIFFSLSNFQMQKKKKIFTISYEEILPLIKKILNIKYLWTFKNFHVLQKLVRRKLCTMNFFSFLHLIGFKKSIKKKKKWQNNCHRVHQSFLSHISCHLSLNRLRTNPCFHVIDVIDRLSVARYTWAARKTWDHHLMCRRRMIKQSRKIISLKLLATRLLLSFTSAIFISSSSHDNY